MIRRYAEKAFIAITVLAVLGAGVGLLRESAKAQTGPVSSYVLMQPASAAVGNGTVMDTSQLAVAVLQTSGTFVGTVTYEATAGGGAWSTLTCYTISGSSGVTTAAAAAIVRCNVAGFAAIRARISAYTSGNITVAGSGTSIPMPFLATSN